MIGGLTAGFFGSGIKIVPSGMMWYYGVVLDGDAMAIEIKFNLRQKHILHCLSVENLRGGGSTGGSYNS
jgi:hypothetical protein